MDPNDQQRFGTHQATQQPSLSRGQRPSTHSAYESAPSGSATVPGGFDVSLTAGDVSGQEHEMVSEAPIHSTPTRAEATGPPSFEVPYDLGPPPRVDKGKGRATESSSVGEPTGSVPPGVTVRRARQSKDSIRHGSPMIKSPASALERIRTASRASNSPRSQGSPPVVQYRLEDYGNLLSTVMEAAASVYENPGQSDVDVYKAIARSLEKAGLRSSARMTETIIEQMSGIQEEDSDEREVDEAMGNDYTREDNVFNTSCGSSDVSRTGKWPGRLYIIYRQGL